MYDAIVVGARCAGSPTAMLLARRGYRVLLVDRASFPSDTISTHFIHQAGVARMKRWGLLDALVATGCPPIERQILDVGPFALAGGPAPAGDVKEAYAPRRTVLDQLLLDAAARDGVEVRMHFAVTELVEEDGRVVGVRGRSSGGDAVTERAGLVIGADGVRSLVARLVGAPEYEAHAAGSCAYYAYWSGVPLGQAEFYVRPDRAVVAAPTHDGLTLVIVFWPESEFDRVRSGIEGEHTRAVDLVPGLAARVRAGTRVEKFRGSGDLRGFFRKPWGPGWALVGDAGYHKNPITAEGITDAFRDAELLTTAIDDGFSGRAPMEDALAAYERARNEAAMPIYRMTCDMARLAPPTPEQEMLFGALKDDERETGRFFGLLAGTVPIPEYFSEENLDRVMSRESRVASR